MEEFFLRRLFSFKELDIVYQQHIQLAVFVSEGPGFIVIDGGDQLIREHLRGHIKDLGFRIIADYLHSDGLHQVSLAESGSSVNKQRVINISRGLSYRDRNGVSVLIRITDYEIFEIKTRIEELLLIKGVLHLCSIYLAYLIILITLDDNAVWFIHAAVDGIFDLREVVIIDMSDETRLIRPRKINNTGFFLYVMDAQRCQPGIVT